MPRQGRRASQDGHGSFNFFFQFRRCRPRRRQTPLDLKKKTSSYLFQLSTQPPNNSASHNDGTLPLLTGERPERRCGRTGLDASPSKGEEQAADAADAAAVPSGRTSSSSSSSPRSDLFPLPGSGPGQRPRRAAQPARPFRREDPPSDPSRGSSCFGFRRRSRCFGARRCRCSAALDDLCGRRRRRSRRGRRRSSPAAAAAAFLHLRSRSSGANKTATAAAT